MEFLTKDGTRKAGMMARARGKGGTIVRLTVDPMTVPAIRNGLNQTFGLRGDRPSSLPKVDLRRETFVVKDLMDRKSWFKPAEIGIGPDDLGVAFSVSMCDVEVVR